MTQQAPIGSGFGAASTAMEVVSGIDLSGKLVVVTGGASGIGLETTRALLHAGAEVVVPARSPKRAMTALRGLYGVTVELMDLADPRSVAAFADRVVSAVHVADMLLETLRRIVPVDQGVDQRGDAPAGEAQRHEDLVCSERRGSRRGPTGSMTSPVRSTTAVPTWVGLFERRT